MDEKKDQSVEEKYGPVVERYFREGEEPGNPDVGLDVAIDRLCLELSRDDGPLEQLRLDQQAEDEWTALRDLLPPGSGSQPPRYGDRPVIQRMNEVWSGRDAYAAARAAFRGDESEAGIKIRLLRRLLDEKLRRRGLAKG